MHTVIAPRDERTQPMRIVPGYPQTPWRNPKEPLVKRPPTLSELTGPLEVARRVKLLGGDIAGHGDKQAIGQLMHLKLAGERRGALHPPERRRPCAGGRELLRRGAPGHGRIRRV
jgi:hypothetical protein